MFYNVYKMFSYFRVEMKLIGKTSYIRGFSLALMVFTERTALYATIVMFVLGGNQLRGDIVFSISQYYNLLQLTVSIMFPFALSTLGEARISVKRIQVNYFQSTYSIAHMIIFKYVLCFTGFLGT